jgi:hypothetical protein
MIILLFDCLLSLAQKRCNNSMVENSKSWKKMETLRFPVTSSLTRLCGGLTQPRAGRFPVCGQCKGAAAKQHLSVRQHRQTQRIFPVARHIGKHTAVAAVRPGRADQYRDLCRRYIMKSAYAQFEQPPPIASSVNTK